MGRHSGAGSRAGSSGQHPCLGEEAGLGQRERSQRAGQQHPAFCRQYQTVRRAAAGALWVSISRATQAIFHLYPVMAICLPEADLNCTFIREGILSIGLLNLLHRKERQNIHFFSMPKYSEAAFWRAGNLWGCLCSLKEAGLLILVSGLH